MTNPAMNLETTFFLVKKNEGSAGQHGMVKIHTMGKIHTGVPHADLSMDMAHCFWVSHKQSSFISKSLFARQDLLATATACSLYWAFLS